MNKQFKNKAEFLKWYNKIEQQRQNKWLEEREGTNVAEMFFSGLEPMTQEELGLYLANEGYDSQSPFIKHKTFVVECLVPEISEHIPCYKFVGEIEADTPVEALEITKKHLQEKIQRNNEKLVEMGCDTIPEIIKLRAAEMQNGNHGEWFYENG